MKYRIEFKNQSGTVVYIQTGVVSAKGTWTWNLEEIRRGYAGDELLDAVSIHWEPV